MKALKLIIIALVMAGALTGLMLLSLGGESEETATPEQEELYSKLKKKIEKHWSDGNWSLAQFNDDHIMLNKQKDELGRQYYTSLTDQLNSIGNRALYKDLKNAYEQPSCTQADIDPYMSDMNRFLQKARGYDKDKLVKEMQATYSLYTEALALAKLNFNPIPSFNMSTNSFSPSFRNYRKNQLKAVNEIRNNEYFSNISNIKEVKQGLGSVPTRLDQAEDAFMAKLAKTIVDAYEKEKPQQLSSDSLSQHRSRFISIRKKFNDEFQPKTNSRIEAYIRSLPITSND